MEVGALSVNAFITHPVLSSMCKEKKYLFIYNLLPVSLTPLITLYIRIYSRGSFRVFSSFGETDL
jgi:hypothetical protein